MGTTDLIATSLARARERLAGMSVDAALITNIENVRWMSGFSGSSAAIVLSPSEAVFITDSRYDEQAHEQVKGFEIHVFASPTRQAQAIGAVIHRLGLTSVSFEAEHVTFATMNSWANDIPGIEFTPVEKMISPLRMVKSAEEVEKIRRACGIGDACFEHVLRMLRPGVTEYDVALDIEFFIRRQGAKIAFDVIAVSGERSARPHGTPSERKLEVGDFVTLDFGACVDGWNSDLTRTVVIGEATDRHREVFDAVLRAEESCIAAMKPGVAAKDVDALARRILAEKGFDKYFGHGLGHGLGSTVHDVGSMNPNSTDVLEPGQVWTVEPGVYIPGFGGCRIEDDVVVTSDGVEVLTHASKPFVVP
ncbi:MAG: Aminopeptidase YpdF [Fimbriimonadales bacterium]|nr:aminopeptidase P family protein [Armatimonadota bacterium]MBV6504360.1 Aminopeptidase YpdF [Fimbriimonadales bacterium]